ncbi:MAG: serine hydrolase domain-containing protein, partial [Thermomicrobiales bacterium]
MTSTSMEDNISAALRRIDGWIGQGGVRGVSAAVWHAGEMVAVHHAGDARAGEPVGDRTLFALASVTKPVSASTVVSLVDEGSLDLDSRVVDVAPEFAAAATGPFEGERASITVRQLLSHTSGLPEDLPRGLFRRGEPPTLEQLTDAMLILPLEYQPGTQLVYSNAGFGILARIVENVSGEHFWDRTWRRI